MTGFIVIAAVAALVTGLAVAWPMARGRGAGERSEARAAGDAAFHRDQLAEIDRDLERGTISASEAEGAKAEVARRLLAAGREAEREAARELEREAGKPTAPGGAPGRGFPWTVGAAALLIPAIAAFIHAGPGGSGNPGLPDRPFAARDFAHEWARLAGQENPDRPDQAEAEALMAPTAPPDADVTQAQAEYARLVGLLEDRLAETPNDARGLRLLAESYTRLERHAEAWRVFERLIGVLGADQAEADLFARAGEGMILAAGGYVSPEAGRMIGAALERDRANHLARYYAGLSLNRSGLVPQALRVWRDLRADAPADAAWLPLLDEALASVAHGVGEGTGGLPGPTRAEVEAAAQLSDEERREMILGMVSRLEARLTTDGGSADEWVRLMTSHVRLGSMEDARRVFDLGRSALKGQDAGYLRERALALGVIAQ